MHAAKTHPTYGNDLNRFTTVSTTNCSDREVTGSAGKQYDPSHTSKICLFLY